MFYLIDKPLGITSFFALGKIRKILGIKKIGHAGTLDPLATGLLIVATEGSTKLIPLLDKADKTYEFEVDFSITSESLDLGTPSLPIDPMELESGKASMTIETLKKRIAEEFSGEISQIPPSYSAIRIDGKRAYNLSRAGKAPEMKARKATIFSLELLSFEFPKARFRAHVSAGTYIRSLGRDIGDAFGLGGVITELRRTKAGSLRIENAVCRNEFSADTPPLPYEELFPDFTLLSIDASEEIILLRGITLPLERYKLIRSGKEGAPCLIEMGGRWYFMGEIIEDQVVITRGRIS